MREALYFHNPRDFCDFVRMQGGSCEPQHEERFELYRVVHPDHPRTSSLVVFNIRPLTHRPSSASWQTISADPSAKRLRWSLTKQPARIIETFFAKTLVECVDLIPWDEDTARRAAKSAVLFVCSDPAAVTELIGISLQLGNDRIQFGSVAADEHTQTVVRIETPSFFLVQKCLEEWPDQTTIYYQENATLFVRWGYQHPLRQWWQQALQPSEPLWIFYDRTNYAHVAPIDWRDAYDLADLRLDFQHRQVYSDTQPLERRFTIPLRLASKASDPAEPELWLLDQNSQQLLEQTLQITAAETLRSWQITIQTEASDSTKRDWMFIRELRAQPQGSKHHDFGGTAFARYQGINDLLLPVGFELQPPLRRDALRQLFELEPGYITVLVPEDSSGQTYLILKISERSFDSLTTYIDYLVERDSAVLKDIMSGSVFDFEHYLKAPTHLGLSPATDAGNRRQPVDDLQSPAEPTTSQDTAEGNLQLQQLDPPTTEVDESTLAELERQELDLERKIINSGQSYEDWLDLLHCKNQLGKSSDALLAATEAMWLNQAEKPTGSLLTNLAAIANNLLDKPTREITRGDSEWQRRAAVFSQVLEPPTAHNLDQWISETIAFLREHESGIRIKERWFAWEQVLQVNGDIRQQTRLREEIETQIASDGLSLEETPAFIRSRIFLDRQIDTQQGSDQSTVDAAITNLESLQAIIDGFDNERLAITGQAILARTFSNIGDIARAQNTLDDSQPAADPCARAWQAMFQLEALREIDPSRANANAASLESILDQAGTETKLAILELQQLYQIKDNADNPAGFLARENKSRTYHATQPGPLQDLGVELSEAIDTNNENMAVTTMKRMMSLDDPNDYDDSVRLPQCIEILISGLEKFKWSAQGAHLIPLFDSFADRVPSYLNSQPDPFYQSILHSNLALAFLTIDQPSKAFKQITLAENMVREQISSELDFVDAMATLVATIEQLPLSQRGATLTNLMSAFSSHFDVASSRFLANERLFSVIVKLMDQLTEAASSRDKLTLQQFHNYQLQDEFLILQRVQNTSSIGNPQTV